MAGLIEAARSGLGFPSASSSIFPHYSLPDFYGFVVAKFTSIVTLPLPLLSFLALPFFGGTSTTISLAFFWLTWTALVMSHGPLRIELMGTLVIRILCYLLPALGFLGFDLLLPSLSKRVKARGQKGLPQHQLDLNQLLRVAAIASCNVLLSVGVQGVLELCTTRVFHMRSILKVSTVVPMPWSIFKDLLFGFVLRGLLRYGFHRFLLHTYQTPLKAWHLRWQHSITLPFSLVAAYDHPAAYLVTHWLPTFLPAYFFRYHVLTWHLCVAIASLEDLFVYSGYAVLPSSIVLAGMARRTDAHFEAAKTRGANGNFGHLGFMDLICRTSLASTTDVLDDVKGEARKRALDERVEDAVAKAMAKLDGSQKSGRRQDRVQNTTAHDHRAAGEEDEDADEAEHSSPRKSRWRKGRKG